MADADSGLDDPSLRPKTQQNGIPSLIRTGHRELSESQNHEMIGSEAKMARISFTANLARHRDIRRLEAEGATLRAVLEAAMQDDPLLRSYVLDEQGRLRKHVNVFINGEMIADRIKLTDATPANADIYIMQALSGG